MYSNKERLKLADKVQKDIQKRSIDYKSVQKVKEIEQELNRLIKR